MKRVLITAVVAAATFAPLAFAQSSLAQSAYDPYPTNQAQLQREHQRAMKAGDQANDPFDSSSSDALNRQQVQAAQGASPVVWPSQDQTGTMGDQYVAPDSGTVGDQYISPNTCITPPQAVPPGAPQPQICDSPTAPAGTPPQSGAQVW